jgi:4-amino-4-deoxy-L-arabinose transferase-like glycosyltransferase
VTALLRRVPLAGWLCAAAACSTTLAWSLLTPPFHVPDEIAHFAYSQYIVESDGKLPRPIAGTVYSDEEQRTMDALAFTAVIGHADNRPPWTKVEERAVNSVEASHPSRLSDGGQSVVTNNPPLYYLLEAVPYALSPSHDILDRLAFMRLLSALLAGITVLVVYLFLREVLPGTPWAWTVGGLAAAFQPLFGFIDGGVNNDALLYLGSALVFFSLARAFRRGLTARRGALIGGAVAIGVLGKATLLAFLPAVGFALLVLIWRAGPQGRLAALKAALVAVGVAAAPVVVYALLNETVWDRPLWSGGEVTTSVNGRAPIFKEQLSYLWQLYLPRLPFMDDQFPASFPPWETWFKGSIGRYGWLDYGFDLWVYKLALAVFVVLAALCAKALIERRHALCARRSELATYALAAAGLCTLIAVAGYRAKLGGQPFEQARYLMPLLPLYAAFAALAARGAGRRLGPAVGAAIVVLAIGHSLFSQLLTISRYYG